MRIVILNHALGNRLISYDVSLVSEGLILKKGGL